MGADPLVRTQLPEGLRRFATRRARPLPRAARVSPRRPRVHARLRAAETAVVHAAWQYVWALEALEDPATPSRGGVAVATTRAALVAAAEALLGVGLPDEPR